MSNMSEHYPDEFGKIALAMTSAQLAKQMFVEESGVGEDMSFNFIGWKDGYIAVIAQMGQKYMKEIPVDRLGRVSGMLRIMRGFWEVDSITMIAEGWCSADVEKTKGLDLHKAFLNPDNQVSECITVTHAEPDEAGGADLTLVSVSYAYKWNKKMQFKPLTVYKDGAVNTLRDKSYPALLYKTITEDYIIDETDESDAAEAINSLGFTLQVFY